MSAPAPAAPPAAPEDKEFEYTREADDEATLQEEEAQDQGDVAVRASPRRHPRKSRALTERA